MVCVSVAFWWVCSTAFVAEYREDVRITIPAIAKHLKASGWYARNSAIELLSRLVVQRKCYHHFPVGVLKHHDFSRILGGYSDHDSCHCGTSEGF